MAKIIEKCKNCNKIYDLDRRQPLLVNPCKETFCSQCLNESNNIKCPGCKKTIVKTEPDLAMHKILINNEKIDNEFDDGINLQNLPDSKPIKRLNLVTNNNDSFLNKTPSESDSSDRSSSFNDFRTNDASTFNQSSHNFYKFDPNQIYPNKRDENLLNRIKKTYRRVLKKENNIKILELHISCGTTPPQLFSKNWPKPFLPDDKQFIQVYNKRINEFSVIIMRDVIKRFREQLNYLNNFIRKDELKLSNQIGLAEMYSEEEEIAQNEFLELQEQAKKLVYIPIKVSSTNLSNEAKKSNDKSKPNTDSSSNYRRGGRRRRNRPKNKNALHYGSNQNNKSFYDQSRKPSNSSSNEEEFNSNFYNEDDNGSSNDDNNYDNHYDGYFNNQNNYYDDYEC